MELFSEDKEPQQLNVIGKKLTGTVCGHDVFKPRKAQLNTMAASLMNMDWTNKSAHCYIYANCSHIEWFLEKL